MLAIFLNRPSVRRRTGPVMDEQRDEWQVARRCLAAPSSGSALRTRWKNRCRSPPERPEQTSVETLIHSLTGCDCVRILFERALLPEKSGLSREASDTRLIRSYRPARKPWSDASWLSSPSLLFVQQDPVDSPPRQWREAARGGPDLALARSIVNGDEEDDIVTVEVEAEGAAVNGSGRYAEGIGPTCGVVLGNCHRDENL